MSSPLCQRSLPKVYSIIPFTIYHTPFRVQDFGSMMVYTRDYREWAVSHETESPATYPLVWRDGYCFPSLAISHPQCVSLLVWAANGHAAYRQYLRSSRLGEEGINSPCRVVVVVVVVLSTVVIYTYIQLRAQRHSVAHDEYSRGRQRTRQRNYRRLDRGPWSRYVI